MFEGKVVPKFELDVSVFCNAAHCKVLACKDCLFIEMNDSFDRWVELIYKEIDDSES